MMTGTTENPEHRGTGKYEALLARCKRRRRSRRRSPTHATTLRSAPWSRRP